MDDHQWTTYLLLFRVNCSHEIYLWFAKFSLLRYGTGEHAPGLQHAGEGFYKCAYVSLLAHAKAYHIYNDEFRASQGGIAKSA